MIKRTLLATVLFVTPALADGGPPVPPPVPARALPLLVHNGSLMMQQYDPTSGHILIQYKDPRPGLWPVGVIPGTVLFDGQMRGPTIAGTAVVFSGFCPPMPYRVVGGLYPNGTIVLRGLAPVVDPYSCNVITLVPSHNSELVFTPY